MGLPPDCNVCNCPEIRLMKAEITHIVDEIQKYAATLKELNLTATEQIMSFKLAMSEQQARLQAGSERFDTITKNQCNLQNRVAEIELARRERQGEEKAAKRLGLIGAGTGASALLWAVKEFVQGIGK